MSRVRIYPYNVASASAKKLSEQTGFLRLRPVGSAFRPRQDDVIINWGSSRIPDFSCRVLNSRQSIINAANKLEAISLMASEGVEVPQWWTSKENLPEGVKIVARTVLTGHSGEGIVIGKRDELPDAPLYTKYLNKSDEFRVHVVGEKAVFVQRKARKLDNENPNWEVRNLANGFVFVEYTMNCPNLQELAVRAVKALGLDFGAVDIVQHRQDGALYVLEVNTACGLEERTAVKYSEAFKEMLNE